MNEKEDKKIIIDGKTAEILNIAMPQLFVEVKPTIVNCDICGKEGHLQRPKKEDECNGRVGRHRGEPHQFSRAYEHVPI